MSSAIAWRFLTSRKLRACLTALGVALGVALITALTVLGATLQASIADQLREGFGTYDVMAGYHDRLMTPAEQTQLARLRGVRYSIGVLYLDPAATHSKYTYIGIGEFPKDQFAYPLTTGHYPGPGEFVTAPDVAAGLGIEVGDTVSLPVGTVRLAGLTRPVKSSTEALFFSLPWLQVQMSLPDQVTLMLFGADPAGKQLLGANLRQTLPNLDIQLRTELDQQVENMAGLKPVAIVFGIAGLFAAIFLVAGSFTVAIQERSRELALLRAVGASPVQVEQLVRREAALLGALGGLGGAAIGICAAWGALGLAAVSLDVRAHAPVLPWLWLAVEAGGGALLAVAAAWQPARAAGRIPPLQAMRPDAAREVRLEQAGGRAGLVTMAVAVALIGLACLMESGTGGRVLIGALGGLLFTAGLLLAQTRVLPRVVGALARPLAALFPAEAVLAGRSVLRHRRRSALTAATLVLGVMLVTSIGFLFVGVMETGSAYTRSQYATDAFVETRSGDLGPDLAREIAAVPGVTGTLARGARHQATPIGPGYGFALVPIDLPAAARLLDFGTVRGDLSEAGIVISEQQSRDQGFRLGDTIRFQEGAFRVIAVAERLPFHSFDLPVSRNLFPAAADQQVYFNYDHGRRTEVLGAVRALLRQPQYGLASLSDFTDATRADRQMANQRFAIIGAVVFVIFLTAAFGLFNALVTGLQERQREIAILRAVGATPAQITRQVILEAGLVGLAGSLLGVLAGAAFTVAATLALDDGMVPFTGWPLYPLCLAAGPVLAMLVAVSPALRISRAAMVAPE